MTDLRAIAIEYGFTDCFLFPNEAFPYFERRMQSGALHKNACSTCFDPPSRHPWANAICLLILTYTTYQKGVALAGSYPPSNASYHAQAKLLAFLSEQGVRAERCYVPLRELMLRSGLGTEMKNGLTAIPPYGTRFVAQTFLCSLDSPTYFVPRERTRCIGFDGKCSRCENACPTRAIHKEDGFRYASCVRAYMEGEEMPPWVMQHMTCMLGCDLCQSACPYNDDSHALQALPAEFDLARILSKDVKPALKLVGTNQNKNGRLIAQAMVIAANEGRTDLLSLIRPFLSDEREAVAAAAKYAVFRLHEPAE